MIETVLGTIVQNIIQYKKLIELFAKKMNEKLIILLTKRCPGYILYNEEGRKMPYARCTF